MIFNRISRKAFTIVEMSIVLIVLGLVASVAIRVKDLTLVSKRRTELSKVLEIQKGVFIFRESFGRYPGSDSGHVYRISTSYNAYKDLVNSNIIADDSFYIKKNLFTINQQLLDIGDTSMWVMVPCFYKQDANGIGNYLNIFPSTDIIVPGTNEYPDMCLTISYRTAPGEVDQNRPYQGPQTLDTWEMLGTLMGSFESLYDDQNYFSGVARANSDQVRMNNVTRLGYNAYLTFSRNNAGGSASSKSSADDIANNKRAMNRLLNVRSATLPGLNDYIIYLIRI